MVHGSTSQLKVTSSKFLFSMSVSFIWHNCISAWACKRKRTWKMIWIRNYSAISKIASVSLWILKFLPIYIHRTFELLQISPQEIEKFHFAILGKSQDASEAEKSHQNGKNGSDNGNDHDDRSPRSPPPYKKSKKHKHHKQRSRTRYVLFFLNFLIHYLIIPI